MEEVEIPVLRAEEASLTENNDNLRVENRRLRREESRLVAEVEESRDLKDVFRNPDFVGRAEHLFDFLPDGREPEIVTYVHEGRRYFVTNLVLGTFKWFLDPAQEITAGQPAYLTLEFEPHSVLSDKILGDFLLDEVMNHWYVTPEYNPAEIKTEYDKIASGKSPLERTLNLRGNEKEIWRWKVFPEKNFEKDVGYLIFYMGYETKSGERGGRDILHETIEWKEKHVPGLIARIWSRVKEFLNLILGALAALMASYASYLAVKVNRLQLRLKSGVTRN